VADPPTDPGPGDPGNADPGPGDRPQPSDRSAASPRRREPEQPQLVDLFALGTACAICIVAAGAGGYLLDGVLHTSPWLTFAGLAFGVTSAVLLAVARLRRYF